jgi:hypothetical protein
MNAPDLKLLRAVQHANEEHDRRIKAERNASMLRLQNQQLRDRLRRFTTDAQPAENAASREPAFNAAPKGPPCTPTPRVSAPIAGTEPSNTVRSSAAPEAACCKAGRSVRRAPPPVLPSAWR